MGLTDPPAVPKDRQTRVRLGVVSQEPLRIKFHWVNINTWIMRNLPVRNVRLPSETGSKKGGRPPPRFLTHQMFAITEDPLGMKYPL